MVIYADVLLVLNLFVNYFLLLITKRLLRVPVRRRRILCGAFLGALYSLVIFAPLMPTWLTILFNIAAVSVIVAASFPIHSFKAFFKAFAAFFAVNFAFGGAMLAIWLVFHPSGMVYQNGAVYFNIRIEVLLCSTVCCYLLFSLLLYFVKRKAPDNRLYTVVLEYQNKSVQTQALFDTGNSLTDGFSNTPVLVTTDRVMRKLVSDEVLAFLHGEIPEKQDASLRFIPCATVNGSGMLRGLIIDRVCLPKEGIFVEKPILAESAEHFDTTEYEVILSNYFFERGEKKDAFQSAKHSTEN